MRKIFCDDKLNLNNYNLSYDFLNNIGIDAKECYPSKIGFNVVGKNKENYILVKILEKDLTRYFIIFEILKSFKICDNDLFSDKKYFFDYENEDYYIVFKLGKGVFKKWLDINLSCILGKLNQFYKSSKNILNELYKFENYMEILTLGNEIKFIDKNLDIMKNIDKIIFLRESNFAVDKFFHENKNLLEVKLLEAREFFIGEKYRSYCEDYNNIRFIHGNISNKSFMFNEDKISIVNFYNSSVDLFIKDIAIFLRNSMAYFKNFELNLFVKKLLDEFKRNDEFHLQAIKHYLNIYKFIFGWFEDKYFKVEICGNIINDKIREIDFLNRKQDDFVENYL